MHCLQQCYGLADEALEDALYGSQALRYFVSIYLSRESVPDATIPVDGASNGLVLAECRISIRSGKSFSSSPPVGGRDFRPAVAFFPIICLTLCATSLSRTADRANFKQARCRDPFATQAWNGCDADTVNQRVRNDQDDVEAQKALINLRIC